MNKPIHRKSTGHVCFWGDREYVEVTGSLWYSELKQGQFDPDGYRLGLLPLSGYTKEEFLKDCRDLLADKVDGEYHELFTHPGDEDIFPLPNPDVGFLYFYLACKRLYGCTPKIDKDKIIFWDKKEVSDKVFEIFKELNPERKLYFSEEYGRMTLNLDQLNAAIEIVNR